MAMSTTKLTSLRSSAGVASQRQMRLKAISSSSSLVCRCSRNCSRPARPVLCSSSSQTDTTVTETRTASVQVNLGYAADQAVVKLTQPKSKLVEATMLFPLGLVLENVDGQVVVTEVNEGSAAADADCRVGDVVRATTAYTLQMTYPPMQLMFGGGGTPKLMKMLIPTDKIPFSKVMDAVRSNTSDQGGDNSVTLVLERAEDDSSSGSSDGSSGSNGGSSVPEEGPGEMVVVTEGGKGVDGAVFDPRIFNSTFE